MSFFAMCFENIKAFCFFLYRCVQLTRNKKSKMHKQEQQSFILVLKPVISHLFKIILLHQHQLHQNFVYPYIVCYLKFITVGEKYPGPSCSNGIKLYPVDIAQYWFPLLLIHWRGIYPVDSTIPRVNNQGLVFFRPTCSCMCHQ